MKKTIEWKSGTGNQVTVTCELITSKSINLDGHITTVPTCDLEVTSFIDGKEVGTGEPTKINHPVAVAMIGKVGLIKENYDKVVEAIGELKATPEWIKREEQEKKALREELEYEDSYNKITAAMNQ